jgi:CheY-like chemotaxis protein
MRWLDNGGLVQWAPTLGKQLSMCVSKTSLDVLVVDDDRDARFFLRRLLARVADDLPNTVCELVDGEKAVEHLEAKDGQPPRDMPDIVLVDLNMPRRDGFSLMAWVRQQPLLAELPLVALTTSDDPRDIHRAYAAGADAFVSKYPTTDNLAILLKTLTTTPRARRREAMRQVPCVLDLH